MGKNKKERTNIPSETAKAIDEVESLKYYAAALMKNDDVKITSEMTTSEIVDIMDKYLALAEKKLAEEKQIKTEREVMSAIIKLRREIEVLYRDMEKLKNNNTIGKIGGA